MPAFVMCAFAGCGAVYRGEDAAAVEEHGYCLRCGAPWVPPQSISNAREVQEYERAFKALTPKTLTRTNKRVSVMRVELTDVDHGVTR